MRGRDDGARAADIFGVGEVGPVIHHRLKPFVERGLTLRQTGTMVEVQDDRDRYLLGQGCRESRQRAQSSVRDRTRADLDDHRCPLALGRTICRLQHLQVEDVERRHRVATGTSRREHLATTCQSHSSFPWHRRATESRIVLERRSISADT